MLTPRTRIEIREVLADYGHVVDDLTGTAPDVFTPDVVFESVQQRGPQRDQRHRGHLQGPEHVRPRHHQHDPARERRRDPVAPTAKFIGFPNEGQPVTGDYGDRLVRTAAGWRLAHRSAEIAAQVLRLTGAGATALANRCRAAALPTHRADESLRQRFGESHLGETRNDSAPLRSGEAWRGMPAPGPGAVCASNEAGRGLREQRRREARRKKSGARMRSWAGPPRRSARRPPTGRSRPPWAARGSGSR